MFIQRSNRPLREVKFSLKEPSKSNGPFHKLRRVLWVGLWLFLGFSIGSCLLLRWLPPPTSAFMVYRHVEDLVEDGSYQAIKNQWVSADQISQNVYLAVIAAEDQNFFEHFGFDLNSMWLAFRDYLNGGALRGASTLSQQVAKNLF